MTWGCYRVKRDPPGKNPSRASSISACEHFFDCIWSVLLTYDARYLSSYSLGIGTVQMAISLNLIFNTWRIVRDWCLSENFLPQHLHNQPIFLFWLFALSLIKRQWKILVDGSNVVSSPPPLSTNKSTRLECGECKDCCSLQWCTSITQRSITTTMFPLYCTDSVRWRG